MPRTIWKGAISFGLVHVPIVVHAATRPQRLDFDWIDRRDDAPVGYQRINKRTGKPVASEDIVKGYEYEKGEYVYMNDEDFKRANVAATQTVEIQGFVDAAEVPIYYYDTPYYLAPDRRGEKGYVLLREVLRQAGRLGLARVVLHTRQYLCALLPQGDALMLITLRYAGEILSADDLDLPAGKTAAPAARERDMALRLVEEMTGPWDPQAYRDDYREDLLAAIEKKIKAGRTHVLAEAEDGAKAPRESAKVIDLMSLLKQSIEQRGGARKAPAKRAAPKKKPAAKKTAAKTAAKSGASARRKAA
ncbi:Ku protein [Achromobacter pulmonis]|uniref:Non-homologous end joining protein Ku n=1 Tax=Achromobacter pulmonis TaxID=1389932 RepID=A0A2N8KP78_9BURK|nr:Ku protein [Achromobacter pulmonis]PND35273.1 Ku protein [Achromobacter pulmonis]